MTGKDPKSLIQIARQNGQNETAEPLDLGVRVRALRKARNMGIRRAHVVRVNHRKIVVAGRRHGNRTIVGFARAPRCPVRFVRRGR